MNPSVSQSWRGRPIVRIGGLLPPNGLPSDGDDGDGTPSPPQAPVFLPDWSFRIRGLPGIAELSDADRAAIRSAIVGELACNGFASPRVDVVANGDVTSAYVWVKDPLNELGAQRGISEVPPLAGDELWRYFVSSRFIVATFQGLWDSGAFPRYLDTDGNPAVIYNVDGSVRPDPDAAIRLDGFWLEFREPDTMVTNLWGVAQAAWPDVDFTATIDDRFYPGPGDEGVKVIKTDSTFAQEADITLLNILAAIVSLGGLALAGIVSGWFSGLVGLAIFFEIEGLVAASRDPNLPVTPGTLLASRFPKSQAVGRGLKILFDYKRVRVDAYGISAGAAILPVPREPRVTIAGPREVTARLPAGSRTPPRTLKVATSFRYQAADMRGPLSVDWITSGTILPRDTRPCSDPTRVTIVFDLGDPADAVGRVERISVQITDADQLSASANTQVALRVEGEGDGPRPSDGNGPKPRDGDGPRPRFP